MLRFTIYNLNKMVKRLLARKKPRNFRGFHSILSLFGFFCCCRGFCYRGFCFGSRFGGSARNGRCSRGGGGGGSGGRGIIRGFFNRTDYEESENENNKEDRDDKGELLTGFILVADIVLCKIGFACALTCNRITQTVTLTLLLANENYEQDSENKKNTDKAKSI